MRNKIIVALVALAFLLSGIGFFSAEARESSSTINDLAMLLPESDGVITLDSERLISEALPQILSGSQQKLDKFNGFIEKVKSEVGMDLKDFKHVAIGLKSENVTETEIDLDPVILTRGNIESKAMIALARIAANGKYHTEKYQGKTIYIFSTEKLIEKNKPKAKDDFLGKIIDKMVKGLQNEVAVTDYDKNTLAIGTVKRVKESIDKSPRVGGEVLALLTRKPNSVANMGMVLPEGLSKFITLDNDELGNTLDSIRQIQGAMDVNDGNTMVALMAKTVETADAENLEMTLSGFQMIGKSLLGRSNKPKNKVYARMVENVVIERDQNAVMIDLKVPQSDLNVLIGP
ncbi:MAG: hypothetical protein HKN25_00585 [Pyrinomonadaceae bacterium]|nr:hypothetical protein [Pyrinomonadaceae bacterium]